MKNLVFGFGGSVDLTPCIYEDMGQHSQAVEGVHAVRTIELFERLSWRDDEFLPNGNSVGCRMGGGFSSLESVTQEQIETMRAENNRRQIAYKTQQEQEMAKEIEYAKALSNSGICPKCGTWCYGDCEAN